MGQIPGIVHLVTNIEDVENLTLPDESAVAYVTQTTLSVDDTREIIEALKNRFPMIVGPDVRDICYATQNRQQAIRGIVDNIDVLLVVGAQSSSNSNRLKEIGIEKGVPSYLIDDAKSINLSWFIGVETIGITAGASAPEELVTEVLDYFRSLAEINLELVSGVEENIQFKLPTELANAVPKNKEIRA